MPRRSSLFRFDGRDDAHPRTQQVLRIHRAVDPDPYRNALHDLGVIPRRIVRRQERKLRARRGRQALHVTAEMLALVGVDRDIGRITVDAYKGEHFRGHVESLSPATGAKFSLLPPDNATGNYTKVVQRIPVRIRIDGAMDPKH